MAPELKLPDFPDAGQYLWDYFIDLNKGRFSGMNGPEAFSWRDIEAWCNLRGNTLSSEELDILMAIDREWINAR